MNSGALRDRLEREVGGSILHLDIVGGPEIPERLLPMAEEILGLCCMGVAARGIHGCTCWEPTYDLEQAPPVTSLPRVTRAKCCVDCAYRLGSPERSGDDEQWLIGLPSSQRSVFVCHQGLRRVVEWTHPCGLVVPAGDGDYRPPMQGGWAFKADGSPAELCAGFDAYRGVVG